MPCAQTPFETNPDVHELPQLRILRIAEATIAERGYEATTLADLSEIAGCDAEEAERTFEDRADVTHRLLVAIARELAGTYAITDQEAKVDAQIASALVRRPAAIIQTHAPFLQALLRDRPLLEWELGTRLQTVVERMKDDWTSAVDAVLRRGTEQGVIREEAVMELASSIESFLTIVAHMAVVRGEPSLTAQVPRMLQILAMIFTTVRDADTD